MHFSFQQVAPKAGTPGTSVDPNAAGPAGGGAPPASGGGAGLFGGPMGILLPFLILVPFLFMSFRRQKKEQAARSSLKKGDRVMTQAGLIGELVEMDERIAKLKIAPGTNVQVLASSVQPFELTVEKAKTDKDLEDLKEAKAGADTKK